MTGLQEGAQANRDWLSVFFSLSSAPDIGWFTVYSSGWSASAYPGWQPAIVHNPLPVGMANTLGP